MGGTTAAGGAAVGEAELNLLVDRAQRGDRAALARLYEAHADRIYRYLARVVDNPHDAEDLTLQTFVRMLESIGRFRRQSTPFSAWLFRIAHNLAIDHFRTGRYCRPHAAVPELAGAEEPSAEDHVLGAFARSSLARSLRMLPREQQQVVVLKVLWSLSNAEAAAILEKTEGAVKALQHRALCSLQRHAVPQAA